MSAPLSNRQKAYLAMLANRAFDRVGAEARASQTAADYRHAQVTKACGKGGLTLCSQDDYLAVKAHFQDLLGESGQALKALVRRETEPKRVIEWKIIGRCKEYRIPLTKAEGICRQMTRGEKGLQDADEKTLWNVFFKLRYYESKANSQPSTLNPQPHKKAA